MHGPAPHSLSLDDTRRGLSLLTPALALLILLTITAIAALAVKGPRPANIMVGAGFETPPPSAPPVIEPLEIKAVAPETARGINAAVPFVGGPHPAAKPFHLVADPVTTARAIDCLASALYYEAGNEAVEGQRAVAQVILNRMRHPAYPHSVCGVVYQGATRRTGCQFSFSCDGSMARLPSPDHWLRLRALSGEMLSGAVYAPVGLATHYHTDWVVPYWSAKLDKIRAERTHLFLRWTGWWGTPPAFRSAYAGGEPLIGRLARLSPAHATALAGEVALDAGGVMSEGAPMTEEGEPLPTTTPIFASPAGNFLIYTVSARSDATQLADMAKAACGTQPYCKVMMWTDPAVTPAALPVSAAALDAMAFSYLRNEKGAFEKALWNCSIFRRDDPAQCMKTRVPVAVALPGKVGTASTPSAPDRTAVRTAVEESELIPMVRDEAAAANVPHKTKSGEGGSNLIRRRPGG